MVDADYVTVEDAARRLGKSESQVRRDANNRVLNSVRDGGRIWIRVDRRFRALEQGQLSTGPQEMLGLPTVDDVADKPSKSLVNADEKTRRYDPEDTDLALLLARAFQERLEAQREAARLQNRVAVLEQQAQEYITALAAVGGQGPTERY